MQNRVRRFVPDVGYNIRVKVDVDASMSFRLHEECTSSYPFWSLPSDELLVGLSRTEDVDHDRLVIQFQTESRRNVRFVLRQSQQELAEHSRLSQRNFRSDFETPNSLAIDPRIRRLN